MDTGYYDYRDEIGRVESGTLGYKPAHRIGEGIEVALGWYVNDITGK